MCSFRQYGLFGISSRDIKFRYEVSGRWISYKLGYHVCQLCACVCLRTSTGEVVRGNTPQLHEPPKGSLQHIARGQATDCTDSRSKHGIFLLSIKLRMFDVNSLFLSGAQKSPSQATKKVPAFYCVLYMPTAVSQSKVYHPLPSAYPRDTSNLMQYS